MLITAVLSLTHSNNRIDLILKPAVKNIDKNGNEVYVDSPEKIKFLIEGELRYEILKMIENSKDKNLSNSFNPTVNVPKNQNLIFISYASQNVEGDIRKISFLTKALQKKYAKKMKVINDLYEKNISLKEAKLAELKVNKDRIIKKSEKDLKSKRRKLTDLKVQEKRIINKYEKNLELKKNKLIIMKREESKISKNIDSLNEVIETIEEESLIIRNNTEALIRQRKDTLDKDNQTDSIKSLILSNITQQNMSLSSSLQNQIFNYILIKNKKERNLDNNRQQIENLQKEIVELKNVTSNDQLVSVLQPDLYNVRTKIIIVEKEVAGLEKMMSSEQAMSIINQELNNIKGQIKNVETEMKNIKMKKNNNKPIKTIKAPTITQLPKLNKKHLIAVAAIGIFLMVFISFLLEYLSKYKSMRGKN